MQLELGHRQTAGVDGLIKRQANELICEVNVVRHKVWRSIVLLEVLHVHGCRDGIDSIYIVVVHVKDGTLLHPQPRAVLGHSQQLKPFDLVHVGDAQNSLDDCAVTRNFRVLAKRVIFCRQKRLRSRNAQHANFE